MVSAGGRPGEGSRKMMSIPVTATYTQATSDPRCGLSQAGVPSCLPIPWVPIIRVVYPSIQ